MDMWPAYGALAGVPLLLVRGAVSDLLSAATAAEMLARHPGAELVTVDGVGHAPVLDEPGVRDAIGRVLARVLASR